MRTKENDQDTLQIMDELDEDWVREWVKVTQKKGVKRKRLKPLKSK